MKNKNLFSYLHSLFWGRKKNKKWLHSLTNGSADNLQSRVKALLDHNKPYLKQGYKLKDMAVELHVHEYQLSAYINQVMGMHFTDLLNQYRIEHCIQLLNSATLAKPNTKELIYMCGFRNRNTFATAFKKFTGQNFSDYIKTL